MRSDGKAEKHDDRVIGQALSLSLSSWTIGKYDEFQQLVVMLAGYQIGIILMASGVLVI